MEDPVGHRLYKVNECISKMETLATAILNQIADIKTIRAACPHCFTFSFQSNAFDSQLWWVVYQCDECGEEKKDKKPPVCSVHDDSLVRCGSEDADAEAERVKEKYQGRPNPPMAFRCPRPDCRKIHILWNNGD